MKSSSTGKSPELITLALSTLGTFDFSGVSVRFQQLLTISHGKFFVGHVLNELVRTCALPYLEDDHPEVRKAAANTCCRLFVKDPICYQASSHAIEVISDVLDKLLTVGIADPGV
jgi:FKBP12-rapamycin complex-associated protein